MIIIIYISVAHFYTPFPDLVPHSDWGTTLRQKKMNMTEQRVRLCACPSWRGSVQYVQSWLSNKTWITKSLALSLLQLTMSYRETKYIASHNCKGMITSTTSLNLVNRGHTLVLMPRLSGPRSYRQFGLPGTLWASFSGNITTLLSLFVETVTSHAIFMAFPHEIVCDLMLRAVPGPRPPG